MTETEWDKDRKKMKTENNTWRYINALTNGGSSIGTATLENKIQDDPIANSNQNFEMPGNIYFLIDYIYMIHSLNTFVRTA